MFYSFLGREIIWNANIIIMRYFNLLTLIICWALGIVILLIPMPLYLRMPPALNCFLMGFINIPFIKK